MQLTVYVFLLLHCILCSFNRPFLQSTSERTQINTRTRLMWTFSYICFNFVHPGPDSASLVVGMRKMSIILFNIGILRLQIIGDKEEWKYRESRNNQNLTDWWVTKFSSVWGSARVPSARRASAICLLPMALSFHSTFYSWGESEGVHKFNRSELTLHKQVINCPSINQHHLL